MSLFEALEPRQLASASLNTELVVNGGAEAGLGTLDGRSQVQIPGWTARGPMTVVQYGAKGFAGLTDPGPTDRGRQFFCGGYVGPNNGSVSLAPAMEQTIDVSNLAREIDAGQVRFDFSAALGGFGSEADSAMVRLDFQYADGRVESLPLSSPPPGLRGGITGLFTDSKSSVLRPGLRSFKIVVTATREFGVIADGYVDNISLKLSPVAQRGNVTGSVSNDLDGDGKVNNKDTGLAGATVFVDMNNNKKLDAGEPKTTSNENGAYRIENVPAGKVTVRVIPPKGFRATTSASQTVDVKAGVTAGATPFALSQTALISGKVRWDDKQPFANGTVFDDLDNDGKLDANETRVMTNAKGEFQVVVKAGVHRLRVDRVTGVERLKVNVGNGAFSQGNVITVPPQ